MPVSSTWTDPNTLDLTTGQVLTQTVWENLLGCLLWLFGTTGASLTFTPTVTQSGAVSTSSATGRYLKIGKWVIAQLQLVCSSAGTAANAIIIGGLPVNTSNDGFPHAIGFFSRGGPPGTLNHLLAGFFDTATTLKLLAGAAATGNFGVNPGVTLASGDVISMILVYEGP